MSFARFPLLLPLYSSLTKILYVFNIVLRSIHFWRNILCKCSLFTLGWITQVCTLIIWEVINSCKFGQVLGVICLGTHTCKSSSGTKFTSSDLENVPETMATMLVESITWCSRCPNLRSLLAPLSKEIAYFVSSKQFLYHTILEVAPFGLLLYQNYRY